MTSFQPGKKRGMDALKAIGGDTIKKAIAALAFFDSLLPMTDRR
jgi:hypothetical protein